MFFLVSRMFYWVVYIQQQPLKRNQLFEREFFISCFPCWNIAGGVYLVLFVFCFFFIEPLAHDIQVSYFFFFNIISGRQINTVSEALLHSA